MSQLPSLNITSGSFLRPEAGILLIMAMSSERCSGKDNVDAIQVAPLFLKLVVCKGKVCRLHDSMLR